MIGLISKLFGGNKSEKDVKKILAQCGKDQWILLPVPISQQRPIEKQNTGI